MNIVLDIDGVLADFQGAAERLLGVKVRYMDTDFTKEQWAKMNSGTFWRDMPPLPGGVYIGSRSPLSRNVYLLTARNEKKTRQQTEQWLQNNGIELYDSGHLLFANPSPRKLPILEALAPVRFLDDFLPLALMADKHHGVDGYMLLRPYNEGAAKHFMSLQTVKSVQEFMEMPR